MRRARSEKAVLVTAMLAGLVAVGCAAESPYVRRAVPPAGAPSNQGEAWEVVLTGGDTAPDQYAGEEAIRRDWVLASPPESDLPADAWPEPYRPGLERSRRLFLPTRGDEVIFLQPDWPGTWRRPYPWWR